MNRVTTNDPNSLPLVAVLPDRANAESFAALLRREFPTRAYGVDDDACRTHAEATAPAPAPTPEPEPQSDQA